MEINNVTEITLKRELSRSQIVAETKLPTESNVTKVLGAHSPLSLAVTECFNGEVRVSGVQQLEIMYMTENGAVTAEAEVSFSDRIECAATAATKATLSGRVLDTDIVSIDESGVRVASIIEITVFEIVDVSVPRPVLPDGMFGDERELECSTLVTAFAAKTAIEGDEAVAFEKLLSSCGRAIIFNASAGLDCVIITGEVIVDAAGVKGESMVSGEIIIPFTEEIPATGARMGDTVVARSSGCRVSKIETDAGFCFAVTMQLEGEVYCRAAMPIVRDAFAVTREVEKEIFSLEIVDIKSSAFTTESFSGSITLPEGDGADSIVALMGFSFVAENAYVSNHRVVVDGALTGTVMYFDAETSTHKSVNALLPVKLQTGESADEGDKIEVSGAVGKISVKLRRSGEIDIKADIQLCIVTMQRRVENIVSALSEGSEVAETGAAISVYIAGENETLWACAKSLKASPNEIMQQNPDAAFPLKRGEKILIYRMS